MSSRSSWRSGAKPIALPPRAWPLPSTKGSSMMPRNWLVSWNAGCCAPVAASPDKWESALLRLPPVRENGLPKLGVSVPPLLKKLLIEVATLEAFVGRTPDKPNAAVKFRKTLLASYATASEKLGSTLNARRPKVVPPPQAPVRVQHSVLPG